MIIEERNADTMICPIGIANSHPDRVIDILCAGSKCMAWRWEDKHPRPNFFRPAKAVTEEPERPEIVPANWIWIPYDENEDIGGYWTEPQAEADKRATGYCGLAYR